MSETSELWVVVVITGDWSERWHPRPTFGEWGPSAITYGPYDKAGAEQAAERWNRRMSAETGRAFAECVRPNERLLD
jgi:hypothetical protein